MKSLKTNFLIDAIGFAAIMTALQPRVTGIAIHEWLAVSAAATLALHVALHWDWVVGISRSFFKNLLHASRLNYAVNGLLFTAFVAVMTSGLVISRVVMPSLGLQLISSEAWQEIHNVSANLTLLLMATHFALHWSWIRNTFDRLLREGTGKRTMEPTSRQSLPAPLNRAKA